MMWRIVSAAVALVVAAPAVADSWLPATRATYVSPDGRSRLTVVPRDLESNLAYFEDQVDGTVPAGQQPGGERSARGLLERQVGGRWQAVWDKPLLNDVAPVSALVANGGAYVVTFDDWHSTGLGDHVVVIYRGDGSLVRSFTLSDVLPADYVRALPGSVSSLWWGGKHALSPDGQRVVLKVVVPDARGMRLRQRDFVDVAIDLASGTVTIPDVAAWSRALATVAPIAARAKAEEARDRAVTIAPLAAPTTSVERDWTRYLYQARGRLAPRLSARLGSSHVLPAPASADHADEARQIRNMLIKGDAPDDLAFAAPTAPEALARVLSDAASAVPAGRLKGYRLFVALPAALQPAVRAALAPSGAELFLFDPAAPLPQREEVLRDMGVDPSQAAAAAQQALDSAARFDAEAGRLDTRVPRQWTRATAAADAEEATLEEMADQLEALADAAEAEAAPSEPK